MFKKTLVLLFLTSIAFGSWKFNPHTNKLDYYEPSSSPTNTDKPFVATQDNDGRTLELTDLNTVWVSTADATTTYTLPSVDATNVGAWVTFIKTGSGNMTVDAADSDTIADSGAGDTIYDGQSTETWATLTLILAEETKWVILSGHGTWTTTE